jgi:DNA-binding IclR family transcriptional regulator
MHNARKTFTTAGNEAIATASKAPTKSATVLTLLQREQRVTLPELVAATGWQPHTTRAMLTGLRKKGHAIERSTRDESCR